jgi:hypothetical protein
MEPINKHQRRKQMLFRALKCATGAGPRYRYITPYALHKEEDMECAIYHPAVSIQKSLEVRVWEGLVEQGLADELIWQWYPGSGMGVSLFGLRIARSGLGSIALIQVK